MAETIDHTDNTGFVTDLGLCVRRAMGLSREMGLWEITIWRLNWGGGDIRYIGEDHRNTPPTDGVALCTVIACELENDEEEPREEAEYRRWVEAGRPVNTISRAEEQARLDQKLTSARGCPVCGAHPGSPCIQQRGENRGKERAAFHPDRKIGPVEPFAHREGSTAEWERAMREHNQEG